MIRQTLLAAALALGPAAPALAQFSISIGIDLPGLPQLVRVPGYPVYYAPQLRTNFFFYDGLYWVYEDDRWVSSDWYNGPWSEVSPAYVPLFLLRVPVRYYRAPPPYFRGWQADASPRWGEHWGPQWSQQHRDWDHWDRRSAPAPAPLPTYQRRFNGERYPPPEQQQDLRSRNYRYQPRDPVVRQQFESRGVPQPQAQQRPPNQAPPQPQPRPPAQEHAQPQPQQRPQAQERPQPQPQQRPQAQERPQPQPRADRSEAERQPRGGPENGRGNRPEKDRDGRPEPGR